MVGRITNISDRKDTSFLLLGKALSNIIKFSLLKKVFSCILNGIIMSFWSVAVFRSDMFYKSLIRKAFVIVSSVMG